MELTRKCIEMMKILYQTDNQQGLATQAPLCEELILRGFKSTIQQCVLHQLLDTTLLVAGLIRI